MFTIGELMEVVQNGGKSHRLFKYDALLFQNKSNR